MSRAVTYRPQQSSAIERQEQNLKFKRHHAPTRNEPPHSASSQPSENKGIENSNHLQLEEYEAHRKD
jgi:hypothetical protein